MIEVRELTKRFGRTVAVDRLSFRVGSGEVVGFLGPNGAGKTTTMRILAGCLPASGGEAAVAGADVFRDSLAVRQRIGYLPENVPMYTDLRVTEYLRYRGRLKGLRSKSLTRRVNAVSEQCGLLSERNTIIRRLSKGFRQRVGLADALLHEPPVLLLDEPTIGLDPNQIRHIRTLIASLAQQHTVLISTHILQEVELMCSRVLILDRGRIAASDTPEGLRAALLGRRRVVAEVRGSRRAVIDAIEQLPGVLEVHCEPAGEWSRLTCTCKDDADIREALFEAAARNKWGLRELMLEQRRLEDVFAALTLDPAPPTAPGEEDASHA